MKNIFAKKLCMVVALTAAASSCSSSIEDLSSGRQTSNVSTTESEGVLTGTFSASATSTQTMVYSSEASINIPPGALTVNANIQMGNAVDMGSQIVGEVGGGVQLVQGGTPLYVGADSDLALANPMTLNLPLPVTADSLKLTAASGKLVFIYVVRTKTGWVSGMKPLTVENLVGTFIKLEVVGLGYFQIAYVTGEGATKEMTTALRPTVKKTATTTGAAVTSKPLACNRTSAKLCVRYGANNTGTFDQIKAYCASQSGEVVAECPSTSFLSSCYETSGDLKYFYYTGNADGTQANCSATGGSYSTTFSATGN